MTGNNISLTYKESSARGATPIGLIVLLYDTILADFRRAMMALETNNIEQRVFEMNHSLVVVAHMQNVLDFERGGEAAKRFNSFFNVARGMIMEASVNPSQASLLKLVEIFTSVRQAWSQAERQTAGEAAAAPSVQIPPPVSAPQPKHPASFPVPPHAGEDEPRSAWSA